MKIVVLGAFTEYKKYFILSLARLLSGLGTIRIHAPEPYTYEDSGDVYDLFGVYVQQYRDEGDLITALAMDAYACEIIDMVTAMYIGNDLKVLTVCEPERGLFEKAARLTGEFTHLYPFTDIYLVLANLHEYGRISEKFLMRLFERYIRGAVTIIRCFTLYFEERNTAVFLESMYEERFRFRKLSRPYKYQLLQIAEVLTGLTEKQLKPSLRKAERMK